VAEKVPHRTERETSEKMASTCATNAQLEHGQTSVSWRNPEHDEPIRQAMRITIDNLMRQRKPDADETWLRALSEVTKKLEQDLYSDADSMAEYNDHSTLPARLDRIASKVRDMTEKKSWRNPEQDKPIRKTVITKIDNLMRQIKPEANEEWLGKLPEMSKRLEDKLYRRAASMAEYSDESTLMARLKQWRKLQLRMEPNLFVRETVLSDEARQYYHTLATTTLPRDVPRPYGGPSFMREGVRYYQKLLQVFPTPFVWTDENASARLATRAAYGFTWYDSFRECSFHTIKRIVAYDREFILSCLGVFMVICHGKQEKRLGPVIEQLIFQWKREPSDMKQLVVQYWYLLCTSINKSCDVRPQSLEIQAIARHFDLAFDRLMFTPSDKVNLCNFAQVLELTDRIFASLDELQVPCVYQYNTHILYQYALRVEAADMPPGHDKLLTFFRETLDRDRQTKCAFCRQTLLPPNDDEEAEVQDILSCPNCPLARYCSEPCQRYHQQDQHELCSRTCSYCHWTRAQSEPEMDVCSRCSRARYCDQECQLKHWREGGHKQACRVSSEGQPRVMPVVVSEQLELTVASVSSSSPRDVVPEAILRRLELKMANDWVNEWMSE
jgi:hypothetical protein